jgi:hypothetical protein
VIGILRVDGLRRAFTWDFKWDLAELAELDVERLVLDGKMEKTAARSEY